MEIERYAVIGSRPLDVRWTLPCGEAARRALQSIYGRLNDRAASVRFSGKHADGRPLEGHGHAHFLFSDDDGDGYLDHLTVAAAAGFDPREREALAVLDQIFVADARLQIAAVRLTDWMPLLGLSEAWSRPARCWRSVTPFVVTRHYKERGTRRDLFPRGRLAEINLREELARRGLPELVSITAAPAYPLANGRTVEWHSFRQERQSGGGRRGMDSGQGFVLELAEPIVGPLAVGYGCHFGLGLFAQTTTLTQVEERKGGPSVYRRAAGVAALNA